MIPKKWKFPASDDEKVTRTFKNIASYSYLGITFAASILICLFGGQYLDRKWGTEPYLTLFGAFFGATAGFYFIIKELMQRGDDKDEV